ncbi:hypothetical protein UA75_18070 [Actinoalloteichus sp. GBA129-24]|uniref:Uncharacterized protein n=2 Tax=Pseudonocardiaceae TaxID=2070 RepID=A0AAC9LDC1_9PSEU|nr:hypothetical protein UA74_17545 [Actinoalloteichus fjordicus]APU21604.1 hypothetical protein UA75_18070 [Actinoalloteichus sp. GBA129-24]
MSVLAAAVAVTAAVAGCSPQQPPDPPSTSPVDVAASTSPVDDLRSILLPVEEHPAGSQLNPEMPLREAVARAMPGTGEPSGVVVMPRCVSYFSAIDGLESLEGWYHFGNRADGALFIAFVAEAPGSDALDLIRMRVEGCGEGHQTIQGWPPSATGGGETVSSTLSFTEREMAELPDAQSLGITQSIVFNDQDHELVQTIRQSWQCPETACVSEDSMVLTDDVFIWVHEGGEGSNSDAIAEAMYERITS